MWLAPTEVIPSRDPGYATPPPRGQNAVFLVRDYQAFVGGVLSLNPRSRPGPVRGMGFSAPRSCAAHLNPRTPARPDLKSGAVVLAWLPPQRGIEASV